MCVGMTSTQMAEVMGVSFDYVCNIRKQLLDDTGIRRPQWNSCRRRSSKSCGGGVLSCAPVSRRRRSAFGQRGRALATSLGSFGRNYFGLCPEQKNSRNGVDGCADYLAFPRVPENFAKRPF